MNDIVGYNVFIDNALLHGVLSLVMMVRIIGMYHDLYCNKPKIIKNTHIQFILKVNKY